MATAAKAAKAKRAGESKAQLQARRRAAAKGRAAQAHARHQPGYKPTSAQRAAGRAASKASAFAAHHPKQAAAAKAKRSAAGLLTGEWVTGGNDLLPSCVAAAIANSLAAATGIRVDDAGVLEFHKRISGPGGAAAGDALDELVFSGLGGVVPWSLSGPSLIAGLRLDDGRTHAVAVTRDGYLSWGALVAPFGTLEGAWSIDWG